MKMQKKGNKKVNKEKPDYDLLIQYQNGDTHLIHLSLGNEDQESVLMYAGHENDVFYVSTEATKKLKELLDIK